MKALCETCGTISKTELMSTLTDYIQPNTCVAEAIEPYAHYYGVVPYNAAPNSLFLLVNKYCYLDEVLSYAQSLESCLVDKVNFASAIIDYKGKQLPAIRIKFFPDYKLLGKLQSCLIRQGLEFAPKQVIEGKLTVRINKLFRMEEITKDIYLDLEEKNKGYVAIGSHLSQNSFENMIQKIKNTGSCHLFDAVQGTVLLNGKVVEIVRVFSEGLEVTILECIKSQFARLIPLMKEEAVYPMV
jgi:hypothetical protein